MKTLHTNIKRGRFNSLKKTLSGRKLQILAVISAVGVLVTSGYLTLSHKVENENIKESTPSHSSYDELEIKTHYIEQEAPEWEYIEMPFIDPPEPKERKLIEIKDEFKINEYTCTIKKVVTLKEWPGKIEVEDNPFLQLEEFEVMKGGQVVYSESNYYDLAMSPDEFHDYLPTPGEDITGDGIPNVVLERDSRGQRCCHEYLILSLGVELKNIADLFNWGPLVFEDIDKNGVYEVKGGDYTFMHWNASTAGSQIPLFVLEYKNGKYQYAKELMRKDPPTEDKLNMEARKIQDDMKLASASQYRTESEGPVGWWRNETLPPATWGYMLELIYSSNGESAWRFLDIVWPSGAPGKEEFLAEFKERLKASPYWTEIREMNGFEF